jgi:hypothetical protein
MNTQTLNLTGVRRAPIVTIDTLAPLCRQIWNDPAIPVEESELSFFKEFQLKLPEPVYLDVEMRHELSDEDGYLEVVFSDQAPEYKFPKQVTIWIAKRKPKK